MGFSSTPIMARVFLRHSMGCTCLVKAMMYLLLLALKVVANSKSTLEETFSIGMTEMNGRGEWMVTLSGWREDLLMQTMKLLRTKSANNEITSYSGGEPFFHD